MWAVGAILVAAATLDDPFYDPPEHLVKYETPQQRRSYTAWASKLRNDLVGDDSGYDKVRLDALLDRGRRLGARRQHAGDQAGPGAGQ